MSGRPEQIKAQSAVMIAIDNGSLIKQPCSVCRNKEKPHAHHPDYSKPKEIVWLCLKCHRHIHKIMRHGGNLPKFNITKITGNPINKKKKNEKHETLKVWLLTTLPLRPLGSMRLAQEAHSTIYLINKALIELEQESKVERTPYMVNSWRLKNI